MLSELYAVVRPSVHLSVCLSVRQVYDRKTVEVGIMNFSPYPTTLVFAGKFHPVILMGSPRERQTREGREKEPFSGFKRQYLESKTVAVAVNDW